MSQDLTLNIKTTSDVPQAMDKAKQATTEFSRQAEAVNKRFKDSVKDILLSTVGPMAALALVANSIKEYFEKIKQAQIDANQSAIDGINERMAKEDVFYARKIARLKAEKKDAESAKLQPQTTTFEFLMNDPRAKDALGFQPSNEPAFGLPGVTQGEQMAKMLSKKPDTQEKVRQIIAEDIAKNGMIAKDDGKNQDAAQKASDNAANAKGTTFKGPEGFSNVVGVGANPVMEAMTAQLEESRKQTALLEAIVNKGPGGVPVDYTKVTASSSPSRASLLSGK